MRRTHMYLLMTSLAAIALAAAHAAAPHTAHADPLYPNLWTRSEYGETCGGSCGTSKSCCRIVMPAPPA